MATRATATREPLSVLTIAERGRTCHLRGRRRGEGWWEGCPRQHQASNPLPEPVPGKSPYEQSPFVRLLLCAWTRAAASPRYPMLVAIRACCDGTNRQHGTNAKVSAHCEGSSLAAPLCAAFRHPTSSARQSSFRGAASLRCVSLVCQRAPTSESSPQEGACTCAHARRSSILTCEDPACAQNA